MSKTFEITFRDSEGNVDFHVKDSTYKARKAYLNELYRTASEEYTLRAIVALNGLIKKGGGEVEVCNGYNCYDKLSVTIS